MKVIGTLVLAILVTVAFIPNSFGMWGDIPEEPEVHFKAFVPQYSQIQRDFSMSLVAVDDRSSYHKNAPSEGYLKGADVTVTIYPSWTDNYIIEELKGKTSPRGYYGGNEFVTTHDYKPHALYNMTISVQYGESVDTQEFQFWTIQK